MAVPSQKWETVWITGASTGIGRALALQMDNRSGNIAVSARSVAKLEQLVAERGNIVAYPLDVSDVAASKACVKSVETDLGPIDLAVLGAGVWSMMRVEEFDLEAIRAAVDINYMGVINGLSAILPGMLARRSGHIAIIASVAGYRGLPNSIAYGPTKAALINLAETLHSELVPKGITVSIVNPGFVETPMTSENPFPMPAIMTAEDAAKRVVTGLVRKDYEIVFPKRFVYVVKFLRLIPNRMFFWFVRKFIQKG